MSDMTRSERLVAPFLHKYEAEPGRVPSLDGLRALSIALVLGQYFVTMSVPGGYGVFVFFVISGFLISRLLFAELKLRNTISLPAFYMRRIVRLYPVVLAYCLVVVGIYLLSGASVHWIEPASALFYFCNYLVAFMDVRGLHFQMPFSHFWSLSVEEQFYIVLPAVLLLTRGARRIAAICIASIVIAAALRFALALSHPDLIGTHFFNTRTEFRMDSLAFGVLLACLCEIRPRIVSLLGRPLFALVFCILTVLTLAAGPIMKVALRDTFMGLAVVSIMAGVIFNPSYSILSLFLNSPPLVWIGTLSYSLYVWHFGIVSAFAPEVWTWKVRILGLALTIAVAAGSYYGLERPLLALRKRMHKEKA